MVQGFTMVHQAAPGWCHQRTMVKARTKAADIQT